MLIVPYIGRFILVGTVGLQGTWALGYAFITSLASCRGTCLGRIATPGHTHLLHLQAGNGHPRKMDKRETFHDQKSNHLVSPEKHTWLITHNEFPNDSRISTCTTPGSYPAPWCRTCSRGSNSDWRREAPQVKTAEGSLAAFGFRLKRWKGRTTPNETKKERRRN